MPAPVNTITPAQAATFAKGLRDPDSFPRQFARFAVLVVAWPLVLVWKAPILFASAAAAVAAVYTARALAADWTMVAAVVVAPAVLLALWRTVHRASFAPVGAYLLGGVRATFIYRPRWRRHTAACGLAQRDREGEQVTPRLVRVITRHGRDELRVRLLPGQTPEQYVKAVPALAHAYRVGRNSPELVARVTARCHRSGTVTISFPRVDPLASVTELADVPAATDDSAGALDQSTDLCSLVSAETLAASDLTAADGGQRDRAGLPACVWDGLDRTIAVAVDFAYDLGPIEEGGFDVEEINGRPVQVAYDSEMTCFYSFTVDDQTKVDVIVEDLGDPTVTPGEPCDAGRAALDDVMETIG